MIILSIVLILSFTIICLQYRKLTRKCRLSEKSNVKKDQALKNIAFMQAHELRDPLTAILGLVNLMRMTTDEAEREECMVKLEQVSNKLDMKIRDIITQVEKGYKS